MKINEKFLNKKLLIIKTKIKTNADVIDLLVTIATNLFINLRVLSRTPTRLQDIYRWICFNRFLIFKYFSNFTETYH